MSRLFYAGRLYASSNSLGYIRRLLDFSAASFHHIWTDTVISGAALDKNYVVETLPLVVQRCILMVTDPGDLVLDPPAVPALLPTSLNNGVAAGSRLTPHELLLL